MTKQTNEKQPPDRPAEQVMGRPGRALPVGMMHGARLRANRGPRWPLLWPLFVISVACFIGPMLSPP